MSLFSKKETKHAEQIKCFLYQQFHRPLPQGNFPFWHDRW